MLTKETFIQAITAIRKHEELMDRLDAICREFGDFRPCRIVSWEENGQTVSVNLTDVNALYCYLAEQSVE